jgi:hydroxymethylbilane synthase
MRIGTRGSELALAQANMVAAMIGGCEIVKITTSGDRGAGAGDKSRWVAEIEDALLAGDIDLAVHSAKDLPGELASGLELLGAPARAACEDVLCGAGDLVDLAPGSRVGTSSIRRLAQLRAAREDLDVVPVRGNVDTRLRKLADPEQKLDAIVLAHAGLQRLGRESEAGGTLDPDRFVPAPGQGTLALQGRARGGDARAAAARINHELTLACLIAERECALELGASCHTPLGAHASGDESGRLRLRAWVGLPDGSAWAADDLSVPAGDPRALGAAVASRLRAAGADALLERAQEMAGVGS